MRRLLIALAVASVASVAAAQPMGEVSYEYRGNAYQTQGSAFTTGDSVTAIVTLDQALAPNLNHVSVTPWLVDLDDSARGWAGAVAPYLAANFIFSTDAQGKITDFAFTYAGLWNGISDIVSSSAGGGDYAQVAQNGALSSASTTSAGSWYTISDPWSRGSSYEITAMADKAPELAPGGWWSAAILLAGILAILRAEARPPRL